MSEESHSYSQILRSSSIIGGAQAINYLIGLVRIKAVALLIGPAGVGILGSYTSALTLVGTVADLGVGPSAVREIARAHSEGDLREFSCTVATLRRILVSTGLFGWLLALLACEPLSEALAGCREHAAAIAILGSTLLLNAMNSLQLALLQGGRRVGDYARSNVSSAALNCVVTIAIFWLLREQGIVPSMVAGALVTFVCSAWFAQRVKFSPPKVTWRETWKRFHRILGLGLAFTWNGVLLSLLDMLVRALIFRGLSAEAAGNYQAASTITTVFANVVITAMATDFYPRLVELIGHKDRARDVINQQTEIGVLLALPLLLFVSTFAPILVRILYSSKFDTAGELLSWMALGVFFRVAFFPMWYVQLAKGASHWFAATQTIVAGVQAAATFPLFDAFGIVGVAYAFCLSYAIQTLIVLYAGWKLIGARWSQETLMLVNSACALIAGSVALRLWANESAAAPGGAVLCMMGAIMSMRGLTRRLGREHRLARMLQRVPLGRSLFSLD